MSVPKSMQPVYDGIEPLISGFCDRYLNDEYREMCLHLLEKLCRKRPSPLLAGRKNTWAAAVVYAIAANNYIFDKSQPIHLTADELCAPFGLSKSTVSNKAREIRDLFEINCFNPEWQLACFAESNPAIWLLRLNGFVIDIRMAPVELQEQAYRQGLIPYVPAYREKAEEKTEEKKEAGTPAPAAETGPEEAGKPEEPADFSDIYRSFGVE